MKRLVKWTFCFEENQLEELKTLSKKTGIPQAVFIREAVGRLLKRYGYLGKMEPFRVEHARYYLTGTRQVDETEFVKDEDREKHQRQELQRLLGGKQRRRKGEMSVLRKKDEQGDGSEK